MPNILESFGPFTHLFILFRAKVENIARFNGGSWKPITLKWTPVILIQWRWSGKLRH